MDDRKLIHQANGYEYWLVHNPIFDVFELFLSEYDDDYLGDFDSERAALAYARDHATQE